MDKCNNEADFTLGLIAYHDTPITDTLPGPAQLMFGRRINSRLGPLRSHSTLNTEQKTLLSEKRAAHLKQPTKQTSLATDQPVWVQHPITRKWHQGTVMRPDDSPRSWWVNEDNSDRLVRRNQHDIRPRRMASSAAERPSARTTVSPDVSNENLSPATSPDLNNQSDATTHSPSSSLPAACKTAQEIHGSNEGTLPKMKLSESWILRRLNRPRNEEEEQRENEEEEQRENENKEIHLKKTRYGSIMPPKRKIKSNEEKNIISS
ncbi:hypothetical protein CAPTEDRAFT_191410 [Capitella teleta]|uniref:Uncharacterized protein n=1 Tax=Capitella teleta TaxID=283909 RepID=R7TIZ2_CAPTE|nr:hypothetical protein CAPTEDRAFT_191410 [Capitella teleta]|eukprot:ELT93452.1 hypothetical protein CAPTEDRAFT_191410 [Capitella teleta]